VGTIEIPQNSVYTEYAVFFDDPVTDQYIAFKLEAELSFTVLLMDNVAWQTIPDVIQPPLNLTGAAGDEMVTLEWDEPADTRNASSNTRTTTRDHIANTRDRQPLGYNVYRDGVMINDELVMVTEFEDEDVDNGVEYAYHVTAVYHYGESDPSNVVNLTPISPNPTVAHSPIPADGAENVTLMDIVGWTYTSDPAFTDPIGFWIHAGLEADLSDAETMYYPASCSDNSSRTYKSFVN